MVVTGSTYTRPCGTGALRTHPTCYRPWPSGDARVRQRAQKMPGAVDYGSHGKTPSRSDHLICGLQLAVLCLHLPATWPSLSSRRTSLRLQESQSTAAACFGRIRARACQARAVAVVLTRALDGEQVNTLCEPCRARSSAVRCAVRRRHAHRAAGAPRKARVLRQAVLKSNGRAVPGQRHRRSESGCAAQRRHHARHQLRGRFVPRTFR